ncbi:hypothetical protein [Bacillus norwichensis]|uniref:Lipoprotein n=1 Tax=Bacillus norwichensis TaxID=2762217 RepID=A0ABR8VRN8_9BACI|nr:hypothetical protein [Bacillus norwichensis]MBD8007442.1 hypothetical protein [Bacillus norwichensis]
MKKATISVFILFCGLTLVACTSSEYKKHMQQGREFAEDYQLEKAASAFNKALKEKPKDEHALTELKEVEERLEKIKLEEELIKAKEAEEKKKEAEEKAKSEENNESSENDSQDLTDEEFNSWVNDLIETGDGIIISVEPYMKDDWEVTNVYVSSDFFIPSVDQQLTMVESVGPAVQEMVERSGKSPYTSVVFRYEKDDRIVAEPKLTGGYKIK